jgi:peptidoglycan hydrolase CwlO-like protein
VRRSHLPLLLVVVALLAPATPVGAQSGTGELRERASRQRAQERSLAGGAARLGTLIERVQGQLVRLEARHAVVRADLARDEERLAATRARLRAERSRLARLRARLSEARGALRDRLVALYKTPEPDIATVALSANGFGEVLERTSLLRRVRDQDQRIVETVRRARGESRRGVLRLKRDEARAQETVEAIRVRRDALARMARAVAGRRAALARARSVRLAALAATRASRRSVERRIRGLEAAEARRVARVQARARAAAATAAAEPSRNGFSSAGGAPAGLGGSWAIPAAIVQCESGGQNLPPNVAGASGYYQIVPATWRRYGGGGPAAWRASKAEQDRVAARIWAGGAGADQWVCSALV